MTPPDSHLSSVGRRYRTQCRELARSIATGMLFAAIMLMWQPPWWMWPAVPLVHVFLAALVYVVITPKMFRAKRGLEILPDLVDGRGGA